MLHRKERLIRTAIEIVDEIGIQGLTTKEIAKRQDVSEATLFRHFASKNELLKAVLDYCALNINDDNVKSAYIALYLNIAKCYEELCDLDNAKRNYELSNSYDGAPSDEGPFYHGTKADLQVGDLLTAGGNSNYKPELKMNHIYFTANVNGAGLAAAFAKGE
ncbi:MAG: NAD(+)--rifampin ADP-ribosyltransferase [Dysgonamonadaceae bacterium]|nr:NAD(+)--rifampin ADP-ribosyltransferase [Dysgonamonadaceae bacterium]